MRAIAQKLERNEHEASKPGTQPFVVAAIVVGWLALGLALDDGGGIGRQRLIGAATWLLLIVARAARAARHADPGRDARRARDAARVLGLAAARPLHLPPAQRAGVRAARARPRLPRRGARRDAPPPSRAARSSRCWRSRWRPRGPSAGCSCPCTRTRSAPCSSSRSPASSCAAATPGVYAAAFVAHRGARALRHAPRHVGAGRRTIRRGCSAPPTRPAASRAATAGSTSGRSLLAPYVLRAARARAGSAPAAQACSSGAIVSPKPPS